MIDLAIINKRRKIALICIIFIFIISGLINTFLEEQPRISCTIVSVTIFIYILGIVKGPEKRDALKNRTILMISGLSKIIYLIGAHIEYYFDGLRTMVYWFNIITVCGFFIAEVIYFFRNPTSKKYKYVLLIMFEYLFSIGAFTMEAPWIMYMAIPFFVTYLVYFNTRLIIIASIFLNLFNVVASWRYITQSVNLNNFKYMRMAYSLQMMYMILFTVSIVYTLSLNKKFNDEKLEKISKMHDKAENLSQEVINMAQKVRCNALDTNNMISELENATNNSLFALKDISSGNIANAESVENQTDMTNRISKMISSVEDEAKTVSRITLDAVNTISSSRQLFNILKNKSNTIEISSKEVTETINEFVDNARKVKQITNGIAEISEQTNLLSLNASIESARAGEAGKGFAVVASEIRTLADTTSNLTNDIDKIVQTLENNAAKAQVAVGSVTKEIDGENETIEMTMSEFEAMEGLIKGLDYNFDNIVSIVKELSNFNATMVDHITNLSASSQEVAACTEEALEINKENINKAKKTRALMDDLLNSANKIDNYINNDNEENEIK